ncbi:TIGIT isoform 3 [Pan troglodytes]|nr:T-cell immunoreceptor with Ig and ITIM domains [Pan troglodytes]PNI53992.1 TIGIT isoform 2 [Pan troglodytes]PNI53993.1 TIGIT isoform 3 [Pan troglodytes]
MRWCLLLIWAQGLRQAPLASGMMTGTIETTGNISAEKGGSIILQCHLSSTTAQVTQVNWEQQDQLLAICNADLGWHISPSFKDRVAPGPGLGLTLQSLTMNDTGEYFCVYHTYPDGTYTGRIFLEVLESSVAEHSARFQIPLLGAMAATLVVICTAVIVVVALARKKKALRIHSVEGDLRRKSAGQEEWSPSAPSPPGSCVQAEAAPAGLCGEQRGEDYAELHDYFNVLSYRSLGNCSFFTETG